MTDTDKTQEILNFWFQGVNDTTVINKKSVPFNQWFMKSEAFDEQIRERFEADLVKASQGEYKMWEQTPHGALALIILFDQFSRNLYRNTLKMLATDPLALELTLKMIKAGIDEELLLIERAFFYMPLMHAEDLDIQNMSLQCFGDLVEESKIKNPRNTPYYEYTFDYAKRHQTIIANFNRFPHRNVTLGRVSTSKETAFLNKPGSLF